MISIIIPVYNVENYLCCCLESVLGQTYADIEVILVDDASTDATLLICERYAKMDKRVKVVHTQHIGSVGARKIGMSHASGELITFADGDDWLEPDMYERMYHVMCREQVSVVMCGRYEDTGEVSREVYHGIPEGKYEKNDLIIDVYPRMLINEEFFEWGLFPGLWDKLFRREYIEPFLMSLDERIAMGGDASCVYPCLLNVESIYVMHECLYHYRQTTSSLVKRVHNRELERMQFSVLYHTVKEKLEEYSTIYDLREQWRKYILFLMIPKSDNLYKNFENLDYLFPFPKVKRGSRIILYGAGTYGQRLYHYLKQTGFCKVEVWVDRNFIQFQNMGLPVQSPEILPDTKCGCIVVANTYAKSRNSLYQELIQKYPERQIHLINEELLFSEETMRAFQIGE